MKRLLIFLFSSFACTVYSQTPYLVVLGTVQDAGSPHIACNRDCCSLLQDTPDPERMVVALGLVDDSGKHRYLFEATPDMPRQLHLLNEYAPYGDGVTADGIFLTHAHIGHYTGLMYLGREAMNSENIPVYTMPKMKRYLQSNGPWSQLTALGNINIHEIHDRKETILSKDLRVTAIRVPHRDEFSETVGYLISGPNKSALFIPDIDKWAKWDDNILTWIREVDYAFLDASFFDDKEIGYRDIAEIPHPFVIESMKLFDPLPAAEKSKVYFIHFNHTNPLLNSTSKAFQSVIERGYKIARVGLKLDL